MSTATLTETGLMTLTIGRDTYGLIVAPGEVTLEKADGTAYTVTEGETRNLSLTARVTASKTLESALVSGEVIRWKKPIASLCFSAWR